MSTTHQSDTRSTPVRRRTKACRPASAVPKSERVATLTVQEPHRVPTAPAPPWKTCLAIVAAFVGAGRAAQGHDLGVQSVALVAVLAIVALVTVLAIVALVAMVGCR